MSIVETKPVNGKTLSTPTKFSIRLNTDESIEFRPTGTFAHVTAEQVLKIVTKATVDVTAENNRNKVNFKLTGKDKLFGFLNYFENDLDDESEIDEVKAVCEEVEAVLKTVKISDITLPMTAKQADSLIAGL
tara:strand:- start:163 stop:558 length:396 start_codon:yes stop_codon:yes gene_type:complete